MTFFFTTRRGGVSLGSYAGLNLGDHVQDNPGHVAQNRTLVLERLSPRPQALCLANQVHGNRVATITAPLSTPPDADALITRVPGLLLGVLTADCVPILFGDARNRATGAAHAGWRGALAGVVENTLAGMVALGCRRRDIHALIGPCIRQDAYVVGPEFLDRFLQDQKENRRFFSIEGEGASRTIHFDLPGLVVDRLCGAGLIQENIHDLEICTHTREDFFSHRRATRQDRAPCGRQLAGVWLHG